MGSMKLVTDPNADDKIPDDATAEQLRAEVMATLGELVEGGVIDLQALPTQSKRIVQRRAALWSRQ
jgi:hypothetical protein